MTAFLGDLYVDSTTVSSKPPQPYNNQAEATHNCKTTNSWSVLVLVKQHKLAFTSPFLSLRGLQRFLEGSSQVLCIAQWCGHHQVKGMQRNWPARGHFLFSCAGWVFTPMNSDRYTQGRPSLQACASHAFGESPQSCRWEVRWVLWWMGIPADTHSLKDSPVCRDTSKEFEISPAEPSTLWRDWTSVWLSCDLPNTLG